MKSGATSPFLPTSRAEMAARGWSELDVIIISGDAYVDHPAFGPPLIAGMGERPVWELVQRLRAELPAGTRADRQALARIRDLRGTAFPVNAGEAEAFSAWPSETVTDGRVVVLPSFSEVSADKQKY